MPWGHAEASVSFPTSPPPTSLRALGTDPHQGGMRAGRCPAARTAQRGLFLCWVFKDDFI